MTAAVEFTMKRSSLTRTPSFRLVEADDSFAVTKVGNSGLAWHIDTPWGDELIVTVASREDGAISWAVMAITEADTYFGAITVVQGIELDRPEVVVTQVTATIKELLAKLEGTVEDEVTMSRHADRMDSIRDAKQ